MSNAIDFLSLNIFTDIGDFIKSIVNGIQSIFSFILNLGQTIYGFVKFLLQGFTDTLNLLLGSINVIANLGSYLPTYCLGFLSIFIAGLSVRVLIEVL